MRPATLPTLLLLLALPALAEEGIVRTVRYGTPARELIFALGPNAFEDYSPDKLDFVILGDGYTADQMETFLEDSRRMMQAILEAEPFASYKAFLRIWRVRCISAESGAAKDVKRTGGPPAPGRRNTAFGTVYRFALGDEGDVGRALTATGLETLEAAFSQVPGGDICLIIANDSNYGGAMGPSPFALTVYSGPVMEPMTIHELGHVLARLGDEYNYADTDFTEEEPFEPNLSKVGNPGEVKWSPWVGAEVPLADGTKAPISVFEGGRGGFKKGIYRPTNDGCRMKDNYKDFCFVCREAMIRAIYEGASPIVASGVIQDPERAGNLVVYVDENVPPDRAQVWFKVGDMWQQVTEPSQFVANGPYRYRIHLGAADWGWVTACVLDMNSRLRIPDPDWRYTFEYDYVHIPVSNYLPPK